MTPVIVVFIFMIAAFCVREFFANRERDILKAQNVELRAKLIGKEGAAKIEKLQDKLAADEKTGAPAEEQYKAFRDAHPKLIDPGGKS